ncbi:hypothetical protein [Streptomyces cuspidosporus]|uniref:Uncharacterized protein n=1 Tax=Streptomyces cuspidosporus TaxID=66882 RepID=A0ABP5S7C1_9ACTN
MPTDDLPAEVRRTVDTFLTAVDESAPGLVTGFYLVGSVALGDFHPGGRGGSGNDSRAPSRSPSDSPNGSRCGRCSASAGCTAPSPPEA